MDETIKVRPIQKTDWDATLKGFPSDRVEQLLAVYGNDGELVGAICESAIDHKYYINGQPDNGYASLQAAATALLHSQN
ncbi:MAG: hypothetical protein F6J86_01525 [Symploca sp. SIO1B1]|nr:hypothetical protein [Symploca sp. SIO1C2]NER92541.1 hypothetical protein [Symploca sp. SIO1B1]